MAVILKRIGFVILFSVSGMLGFAVLAFVYGLAKAALSGGEGAISLASAALFGFGWGGALGAIAGAAASGEEMGGGERTPASNIAAWIAGGLLAVVCLAVLFNA